MLDLCIDLIDPQHGYHWFVLRSHHCPPAVITIINSILIQYPSNTHPISNIRIIMNIQVGDKAPQFNLVTLTEEGPQTVQLSDLVAKSTTVLLFVPMAFTGVCTQEFCSITSELSVYNDLNAQVVGISGDNPFAQAAWAEKEGIGITLLSDYEHATAEAYGVAYESFLPEKNLIMGGVPKRSAFVVDQEGVVRYAEVNDSPGDLPDFEAIQACLKSL